MNTVEKLTGKDVRELFEASLISKKEARMAAGFPAYENETGMVKKFAEELYKQFEPDMPEKEFKTAILTVWNSLFQAQPPLPLEEPEPEKATGPAVDIDTSTGTVVSPNDSKTPAELQAEMDTEDRELRDQATVPFDPQPLEAEVAHPKGPARGRAVARPAEEAVGKQA